MEDFNLSQCEESPDAPKIQISRSILELLSSKLHESKTENVKLKQTCEELTKKHADSAGQLALTEKTTIELSNKLHESKTENVKLKQTCEELTKKQSDSNEQTAKISTELIKHK